MSQNELPHRRLNRLTGEWVLVSPQRMKRPWQGETKAAHSRGRQNHDPDCYLCPGNERMGGTMNPRFAHTHIFSNDFPALLPSETGARRDGLLREEPACGETRVICYSPGHDDTLARMDDAGRRHVVEAWCALSAELGERWDHVEFFENKGAMMGASSPHPHGQVWAGDFVPTIVQREDQHQQSHLAEHGTPLLADIIGSEIASGERVVAQNDYWVAIVPHWAAWPFETLLIARDDARRLEELIEPSRAALAAILGTLLGGYDALFDTDFPYSMGWHGAPHGIGAHNAHWRLHAHFYPPLLRSAEVRKHMVGFEMLAETQRDLTPEAAAQRLRECMG